MTAEKRRQCKATSRQSGKRCRNKAVRGSDYCRFHGGQAVGNKGGGGRPKGTPKPPGAGGPPPIGNTSSVRHGAYSARLLPDEQPHFEMIKEAFETELGGEEKLSASDHLLIFRLAMFGAKITAATERGAGPESIVPLQRLELELLRELKATRASKDGGASMGNSPAEVVGALLAKIRERQALAPPSPQPIQVDIIDVEAVEVAEDDGEED
jgi:hypothetical protein